MRRIPLAVLLVLAAWPAGLSAQQPRIVNGEVTAQAAGSPFEPSFHAVVRSMPEVAWIGYAVPSARPDRTSCCYTSNVSSGAVMTVSGCHIEPPADRRAVAAAPVPPASGQIRLEPSDHVAIMFRVVDRRIERVRTFSEGCELDAGGRPIRWLDGVPPADSVGLLATLVAAADRRDTVVNGALAALSLHAVPESADALIRLARQHEVPGVRGQALFWVAQKAGDKAAAEIAARIEEDPDIEVKRRAVFALSQLPADQGVPLLIDVARTHPSPAVKRQAFFWLGQSKDPRALEFFTEVLK